MVTWMLAIPAVVGALAMIAGGWASDRTGERRLHLVGGILTAAVGTALTAYFRSPVPMLCAWCVNSLGSGWIQGPFWSLPTSLLTGAAAAGGIAFINAVGTVRFAPPACVR